MPRKNDKIHVLFLMKT